MFEPDLYDQLRDVARRVVEARSETSLATAEQLCAAKRTVQAAQDLLDGVAADLAARMDETRAFEVEGAPTAAAWMRHELRLSTRQARQQVAAGRTLRLLPDVAEALAAGEIRLDHVHVFTAGIEKVGDQTLAKAAPTVLLPIARTSDPSGVRAAIDHLYETLHPEELEKAWAQGMDRRDIQVAPCGDGYHLTGFLDIITGSKLHTYLKASAGHGPDDTRTPAQRRVDAIGRAIDAAADAGEPSNGIRPQLHVLADLDTLLDTDGAMRAQVPGFGAIGRELLGYLTCTADLTPILTTHASEDLPQARVLNVGRTQRLATPKQRTAIIAQQHGVCANPACTNTQLEIHHIAWWTRDHGTTNLGNLVGLCARCHHLVHQHKLTIRTDRPDSIKFQRATGAPIDNHRQEHRRIRQRLQSALQNPPPKPPPRHRCSYTEQYLLLIHRQHMT